LTAAILDIDGTLVDSREELATAGAAAVFESIAMLCSRLDVTPLG
jgi:beta-phosphoglucomutase-like phosphatase (HAD superfamily)